MIRIFLLIFTLLISFFTNAQYSVVDNQTAVALANTLVGEGVTIINPILNCDGGANGIFNGTGDLGIDSGIVLTSGKSMTDAGGDGVNSAYTFWGNPSESLGMSGDAMLDAVLGIPTYDACILEFDFLPTGDTVKFNFVFASSEYGSFSCTNFNDIFGFFISGGSYATPQNIAVIPGTTIPICVNSTTGVPAAPGPLCTSLGAGSPFEEYYIDNTSGTFITYGGFTTVFQAIAAVTPCDTFHLKLAIADGQDESLDSGVFLEAGSLTSVGISITPESTEGGFDPSPHCIRGCKPAKIRFQLPAISPVPVNIPLQKSGTAISGVDYTPIVDTLIIPAGSLYIDVFVYGLLAPTATGPRSVTIKALAPYTCADGSPAIIDSTTVLILDSLYAAIVSPGATVCPNDSIMLNAQIDTSLGYYWTASPDYPGLGSFGLNNYIRPTATTTFTINVFQPGAPATCPETKKSQTFVVEPYPDIILPFSEKTICLVDSLNIFVQANPLDYNFNYSFTPSSNLRFSNQPNNWFYGPEGVYNYTVTASTPIANCSTSKNFRINVVPPFDFDYISPVDTVINYGDEFQIKTESEATMWSWSPITYLSNAHSESPMAAPLEDIKYTVVGINNYGCADTGYVNVRVIYNSESNLPSVFSPNGDGLNDEFKIQFLGYDKLNSFQIWDRWGKQVFITHNPNKGWDGTINGKKAEQGVYFYDVLLTLPDGSPKRLQGDITLVR